MGTILKPKALEREIQEAVCEYLTLMKIFHTVSNSDKVWNQNGQVRKSKLMKGWPDVSIVYRGRAIYFEIKKHDGRVKPDQADCHALLRQAGALVYVIRSVDDAVNAVKDFKKQIDPQADHIEQIWENGWCEERMHY